MMNLEEVCKCDGSTKWYSWFLNDVRNENLQILKKVFVQFFESIGGAYILKLLVWFYQGLYAFPVFMALATTSVLWLFICTCSQWKYACKISSLQIPNKSVSFKLIVM